MQNFFLLGLKYIRQKDPYLAIVKVFNYFRYVPQNMDIFSHIFKMVTPRAQGQFLLFIALNCLSNAIFITN